MQLRDISFPTPQENLSFDDVLLHQAEKQGAGEFLRFWESPLIFVVLGLAGKPEIDVNLAIAQQDHIPVLKRSSGGGTVVQGPGCLNYSLILSKEKHKELQDLHRSYEWISSQVLEALQRSGVKGYFRPLSDLATGPDEKKFSGNAQRRMKNHILHHGTILYNFDLSLITRYLNMPQEIPEYRKGRPHTDFVTNVSFDPRVFKGHLAQVFGASASQAADAHELSLLQRMVTGKEK